MEIWENFGDSINPDYQGTLLNDYSFDDFPWGEIIRINLAQCDVVYPSPKTLPAFPFKTIPVLKP